MCNAELFPPAKVITNATPQRSSPVEGTRSNVTTTCTITSSTANVTQVKSPSQKKSVTFKENVTTPTAGKSF